MHWARLCRRSLWGTQTSPRGPGTTFQAEQWEAGVRDWLAWPAQTQGQEAALHSRGWCGGREVGGQGWEEPGSVIRSKVGSGSSKVSLGLGEAPVYLVLEM